MDLWSQLTGGLWHTGAAGTPDLGFSEWLGNLLGAPRTSQGGSDIFRNPTPAQQPQVTPPQPPQQTAPAGGGTKTPASTPAAPPPSSFDIGQEAQDRARAEALRQEQLKASIRSNISSAYDPIFNELDRQAGTLPQQQKDLEAQVGNLTGQQKADVAAESAKLQTGLEQQKGVETTRAADSLRNLEQDVRNIMQASTMYFGARGAADSSAPAAASEGITRSAQQSRAKVLTTRNQALAAVDAKINDVKTLAVEQGRKVDEWKSNKLFEVSQWAKDRLDQLNQARASATGQKAQAISALITQTEQQFYATLSKLDDAVFNYKEKIDTWQKQRGADIEDFKTKLGLQAQFTNTTPDQYKIVTDTLGRTFAVNPTNPNDVKDITGQVYSNALTTQKKGLLESLFGSNEQPQISVQ